MNLVGAEQTIAAGNIQALCPPTLHERLRRHDKKLYNRLCDYVIF